MSGPEQRRDRRVDTQQQVWVEGQEIRVEAEARNISRSGMFVVTRNSLPPPGTTLEVKFDDPHEGQVQVTMEVVWRTDDMDLNAKLGLRVADTRDAQAFERVVARLLGGEDEGL
jgi:hypothetical protein